MLVVSSDATYMLQADGSTTAVERPAAEKKASREKGRTTSTR